MIKNYLLYVLLMNASLVKFAFKLEAGLTYQFF